MSSTKHIIVYETQTTRSTHTNTQTHNTHPPTTTDGITTAHEAIGGGWAHVHMTPPTPADIHTILTTRFPSLAPLAPTALLCCEAIHTAIGSTGPSSTLVHVGAHGGAEDKDKQGPSISEKGPSLSEKGPSEKGPSMGVLQLLTEAGLAPGMLGLRSEMRGVQLRDMLKWATRMVVCCVCYYAVCVLMLFEGVCVLMLFEGVYGRMGHSQNIYIMVVNMVVNMHHDGQHGGQQHPFPFPTPHSPTPTQTQAIHTSTLSRATTQLHHHTPSSTTTPAGAGTAPPPSQPRIPTTAIPLALRQAAFIEWADLTTGGLADVALVDKVLRVLAMAWVLPVEDTVPVYVELNKPVFQVCLGVCLGCRYRVWVYVYHTLPHTPSVHHPPHTTPKPPPPLRSWTTHSTWDEYASPASPHPPPHHHPALWMARLR